VQVLDKQLKLGPEPTEVARARRWVRTQLLGGSRERPCPLCPDEAQTDTLVLLVSELVTNAVVHTGRPAVLHLSARGPACTVPVRLEVVDDSSCAPLPRQAAAEDTGGRGLELVELLADRWGWQREGEGKRVWCELDCASGRDTPHDDRKVPASY
jgi:anti-sigma regulatory factor (Ser/Thr protein kinase)